jgi:hypothetical protein
MILKWTLIKLGWRVWIGFIWFRFGSCEHSNGSYGSVNCGVSLAELLIKLQGLIYPARGTTMQNLCLPKGGVI